MTEEKRDQSIHVWQERIAEKWFDAPISEILKDRNQPASISKNMIFDLLEEKEPKLFEQFDEKSIKSCIFKSMGHQDPPYTTISKRKKCFWRSDLV